MDILITSTEKLLLFKIEFSRNLTNNSTFKDAYAKEMLHN